MNSTRITDYDSVQEKKNAYEQQLVLAAKTVTNYFGKDSLAPSLYNLLNLSPQTGPTASGFTDHDYPLLGRMQTFFGNMTQMKTVKQVPLPSEIMDHFGHVQCHCMMGLFPEMNRAWLSVDSDIFMWNYEDNSDLAYYDGLKETILCVGLIKPKPGVFHNFIKFLLVLCTSVDIVVLGVTFAKNVISSMAEIQVVPEPVFTLPTDGATVTTIVGTSQGRIFLGSKEGNVYEIDYRAEGGWFGSRCRKINHSKSSLSFLVPAFINAALSDDDGIVQISVDNSRHILYLLSHKRSIEVVYLGDQGDSYSSVIRVSQASLVQQATHIVKTLDSQNFRPIVSISAVEASESSQIHLVAVTATGVRLYFSTSQTSQRPSTLNLQHVRLPPGYSANITVRPRDVHVAGYRDRNCVLVSTVNKMDVLWCISGDMFPFGHTLMEAYTTINLGGSVIAFAEVRPALSTADFYGTDRELVPLIVRQHYEPPRKYVVMTSQGVHVLLKQRPVDVLRQLLIDSGGSDSEAVKGFFVIESEDQACATALILASLESRTNAQLAEAATRAFFLYGGEPKLTGGNLTFNQTPQQMTNISFHPNVISTPAPQPRSPVLRKPDNTFDAMSSFQFSSKHNGLYLYFSRILRPVWKKKCFEKFVVDKVTHITYANSINVEYVGMILNNLNALHNFLTLNTQLCVCGAAQDGGLNSSLGVMNLTLQDAQLEERRSLDALKVTVYHCAQVFGLWKILCEHQLHNILSGIDEREERILSEATFEDLCVYESGICNFLNARLVNSYLGDNASVDAITNRLREVCPNIYRSEEAAFSKAIEMLKTAQATLNSDEKEDLVNSALAICLSITPDLNLHEICVHLTNLQAYRALIELCYATGLKIDPERTAERVYKNADETDKEGVACYRRRMTVYEEVATMLTAVYRRGSEKDAATEENVALTHRIVQEVLDKNDDIMHIRVYCWLMAENMASDLIKIGNKSLEMFLINNSYKENVDESMDLLWKYYENNQRHSEAADILLALANKETKTITLKQRLSYLARAVMCHSSAQSAARKVNLRDIEDKLDVAKLQDQILTALRNADTGNNPALTEAIQALDSGLYQISQLYENFADPFDLWECKLAIIDCSGYSNNRLVEDIWRNILKAELKNSAHINGANERLTQILSKIKILSRKYSSSVNCFPLEFLVHELEVISVRLKASKSLVPRTLLSMGISMEKLIVVYNKLIVATSNETFWKAEEHEFHFAESIAALITCFLEDSYQYNNVAKRRVISLCQDAVAGILSNLYSKPNTDDLVAVLRNIQAKL